MALTVAHYLLPDAWSSYSGPVAALVVVAITALNLCGIQKSALATRAIVGFVLISLAIVLVIGWVSPRTGDFGWTMYQPLTDASQAHAQGIRTWPMDEWKSVPFNSGVYEVLQAAGLLFFAFAGYARIATLGEEVKDPARTIPRAIPIALGITLLVYCLSLIHI